ncbi:hypothetical protein [Pseudanabaena sp. FACHB-2040]|uniref:hypothetical protein n=1 Tax=Pseudanabaena sp. FACHB-2040 TaxID=2692859 RepID=UPI001688F6C4|nr:hypothetical protein [Pseudanabaena sp. FACHB-2040]MBD2259322.1 hypothetical protein [Pseudanabaena sp. FACHB-2040]
MDTAFQYWQLVCLTSSGRHQIQVLPQVQIWIQQTFSNLMISPDPLENALQKPLITLWQSGTEDAALAQLSLRCFITHQIRGACIRLTNQFGEDYGFTAPELLAQVLDDDGRVAADYRPFTLEILESYDPIKSALSTWSSRLTCNHPALNRLLLEKGLYRASDWAILNDTSPEQGQRILRTYHLCSEYEVAQGTALLEQYQRVYCRDRISQRQSGGPRRCQTPTSKQLQEMVPEQDPKTVLVRLQQLASQLRQYRIHVRGGNPVPYSEDTDWGQIPAPSDTPDEQDEFLQAYRQALENCLGDAIAHVIQHNITRLRTRQPPQDQAYVQGLHLFHCLGLAMGKLAAQIGLSTQVQVNRLLQLKRLRSDVRHQLIAQLCERVRHQALSYISADRLHAIDHTLEHLLTEEVDQIIKDATTEAQIPKGRSAKSLFAHQLCSTIHQFMPDSE